MRVGLVFGGKSVEHLVSIRSAKAIAKALIEAGHDVIALGLSEDGFFCSTQQSQKKLDGEDGPLTFDAESKQNVAKSFSNWNLDIDVVFPIAHGTYGEDGKLQGLFEMMNLPYVGAATASSVIAMDKALCKEVLVAHGLPVVDHHLVRAFSFKNDPDKVLYDILQNKKLGGFPLFIKPSVGGSSVGCKKANNQIELKEAINFALSFHDVVLVEKHVQGRELECAVLGAESPETSCIGEIVPGADFYDYADKYVNDTAGLLAPAPLDEKTRQLLQEKAKAAFLAIGGHGMARVDFFLENSSTDTQLWINEINTLPGFTRISMYPRLWQESGRSMRKLVHDLVIFALERHQNTEKMNQSIGEWVKEQI